MRDSRRPVDQRFEVAFGASNSKVFQHIAARIHDGHNGSGKTFPEEKGGGHGNEGDSVDPHAAGQKIAHHRDEKGDNDGQRARRPHPIRQGDFCRQAMRRGQGRALRGGSDQPCRMVRSVVIASNHGPSSAVRPIQAALTSAATFAVGAAMPLLMALIAPLGQTVLVASLASLCLSRARDRSSDPDCQYLERRHQDCRAQNMVAVGFIEKTFQITITWLEWFMAAAPFAILCPLRSTSS